MLKEMSFFGHCPAIPYMSVPIRRSLLDSERGWLGGSHLDHERQLSLESSCQERSINRSIVSQNDREQDAHSAPVHIRCEAKFHMSKLSEWGPQQEHSTSTISITILRFSHAPFSRNHLAAVAQVKENNRLERKRVVFDRMT